MTKKSRVTFPALCSTGHYGTLQLVRPPENKKEEEYILVYQCLQLCQGSRKVPPIDDQLRLQIHNIL